jgi:hypothetical protein
MRARPAILIAVLMLTGLARAAAAPFDPVYRAIFPAERARMLLASACAPLSGSLARKITGGPNQFSAQYDPAIGRFVDFHFSGRHHQP